MGDQSEAFLTWKLLTEDAFQRHTHPIGAFYTGIVGPLSVLIDTGFLPVNLLPYESDFFDQVKSVIVPGLLAAEVPRDATSNEILLFLEFFFGFGCYGIASQDMFAIELLLQIIHSDSHECFRNSPEIYPQLRATTVGLDLLSLLTPALSCTVQSMDVLFPLLTILTRCAKFFPDLAFTDFLEVSFSAVHRIVSQFPDSVSFDLVLQSLDILRPFAQAVKPGCSEWAVSTAQILLHFLQPARLQQMLTVLRQLERLTQGADVLPAIAPVLCAPDALARLLKFTYDSEVVPLMGSILARVSSSARLGENFLRRLWEQIWQVPGPGRVELGRLFLEIGRTMADAADFGVVADCFLSAQDSNADWFVLLDVLLAVIAERGNDGALLGAIRDILVAQRSDGAMQALVAMVKHGQTGFTRKDLDALAVDDPEFARRWYSEFVEAEPEPPFGYVQSVDELRDQCRMTGRILELHDLRAYQNLCDNFVQFLNQLLDYGCTALEHVCILVEELTEMTEDGYFLIKKLVFKEAVIPLRELPFPHEDLLWKWALTRNSFSDKFARLLARLYWENDDHTLPDRAMIISFVRRWKNHEHWGWESLRLLQIFIETIEQGDDRLNRSCEFPLAVERLEVNSTVRLAHRAARYWLLVPRSIEIGALLLQFVNETDDFRHIPPSQLTLTAGAVEKRPSSRLSKLLDRGIQDFTVLRNGSSPLHRRKCLPSFIVARDPEIVDFLIGALDGSLAMAAYGILLTLPRSAFPATYPLSADHLVLSVLSVRMLFYDLFTGEAFEDAVVRFRDVFNFARTFDMAAPLTGEFVALCCEIICVIERKAKFGAAKQQVVELLLTWVNIPECVRSLDRCFGVLFPSQPAAALHFPSSAAAL
jgi:hypothetical protein